MVHPSNDHGDRQVSLSRVVPLPNGFGDLSLEICDL